MVGVSLGDPIAKIDQNGLESQTKCHIDSDCVGKYLGPNAMDQTARCATVKMTLYDG